MDRFFFHLGARLWALVTSIQCWLAPLSRISHRPIPAICEIRVTGVNGSVTITADVSISKPTVGNLVGYFVLTLRELGGDISDCKEVVISRIAWDGKMPLEWQLNDLKAKTTFNIEIIFVRYCRYYQRDTCVPLAVGRDMAFTLDSLPSKVTVSPYSPYQINTPLAAGPMVGFVTDSTARIWARLAASQTAFEPGIYRLSYRRVGTQKPSHVDKTLVTGTDQQLLAASDWCVVWMLTGLQDNAPYEYQIEYLGGTLSTTSTRWFEFRTFPRPNTMNTVSLAFGACAFDRAYPIFYHPVWQGILTTSPNCLVLLGDTPYIEATQEWPDEDHKVTVENGDKCEYADVPAPPVALNLSNVERVRESYRCFYTHHQVQNVIQRVPTISIWDDHDFGSDDFLGWQYRPDSVQAMAKVFGEYHANPTAPTTGGIYSELVCGPIHAFLLDCRSFAKRPGTSPHADALLGPCQQSWFRSGVLASAAPIVVVVSGMVFHDISPYPTKYDTWHHFPESRDDLFDVLSTAVKTKGQTIVLVSGDLHQSRVFKHVIGTTTDGKKIIVHEFVTGPLAAGPPGNEIINADVINNAESVGVIARRTLLDSFLIIRTEKDASGWKLVPEYRHCDGTNMLSWSPIPGEYV